MPASGRAVVVVTSLAAATWIVPTSRPREAVATAAHSAARPAGRADASRPAASCAARTSVPSTEARSAAPRKTPTPDSSSGPVRAGSASRHASTAPRSASTSAKTRAAPATSGASTSGALAPERHALTPARATARASAAAPARAAGAAGSRCTAISTFYVGLDVHEREGDAEPLDAVDAGHRLQHERPMALGPAPHREERRRVAGLERARERLLLLVESEVREVLLDRQLEAGHLGRLARHEVRLRRLRSVRHGDAQAGRAARRRRARAGEAIPAVGHGALVAQLRRLAGGKREKGAAVGAHALDADVEAERAQAERAAAQARLLEVAAGLPGAERERAVVAGDSVDAQRHDHGRRAEGGEPRRDAVGCRRGEGARDERGRREKEESGGGEVALRKPRRSTQGRVERDRGGGEQRRGNDRPAEAAHAGQPSSRPASRARRSTRRTGRPATFEGEPSTVSMKRAPRPSTW